MLIRVLPAASGLTWIRDGLRLFGQRPLSLLVSIAAGFVLMLLLASVPYIGPALGAVVAPIASLGMIAACRAAAAGQIPSVRQYADGLREAQIRRQLLMLGFVNALIVIALFAIIQAAGLDEVLRIVPGPGQQTALEAHPGLLALRIAVSVPVLMATWLAPPLVGWHGLPAVKAMFFSFFACWRNRWPLLVFIGGVLASGFLVTLVLAGLVSLIGQDETSSTLVIATSSVGLLTLVQCGVFRMYEQIVQEPPAAASS